MNIWLVLRNNLEYLVDFVLGYVVLCVVLESGYGHPRIRPPFRHPLRLREHLLRCPLQTPGTLPLFAVVCEPLPPSASVCEPLPPLFREPNRPYRANLTFVSLPFAIDELIYFCLFI